MNELIYTLLSEGSSDRALLPLLTWLLRENGVTYAIQPQWADLRSLDQPPSQMPKRISHCLKLYPCDVLFIHRDADSGPRQAPIEEILRAIGDVSVSYTMPPFVCVVPIRMQETWLLFDKAALRRASGNPNGDQILRLPSIRTLEELSNPKEQLRDLLKRASGKTGRRLKGFSVAPYRVAELIDDFSPLRVLSAFQALEEDIKHAISENHWNTAL